MTRWDLSQEINAILKVEKSRSRKINWETSTSIHDKDSQQGIEESILNLIEGIYEEPTL